VHLVGFIIRKGTTIIRERYPCPRRDSNPPVPASKRLQAHASGRAAMVIGPMFIRRFRKLKNSDYQLRHICLSVRLSVWNSDYQLRHICLSLRLSVWNSDYQLRHICLSLRLSVWNIDYQLRHICLSLRLSVWNSDYQRRHICLSLRLSVWNNSAPTGRIFMNFEYYSKICRGKSSFNKI